MDSVVEDLDIYSLRLGASSFIRGQNTSYMSFLCNRLLVVCFDCKGLCTYEVYEVSKMDILKPSIPSLYK